MTTDMLNDKSTERETEANLDGRKPTSQIIVIIGADQRIRFVNSSFEAFWNRPALEVLGMGYPDLFDLEEMRAKVSDDLQQVVNSGQEVRGDYIVNRSDGVHYLRMQMTPVNNNGDNTPAKEIICTCQDLKAQMRLQFDLQQSEQTLKFLADAVEDLVFTLDLEGRFTGVFGRWLEIWDLSREDLLGEKATDFLSPDRCEIHRQPFERAIQGEYVTYDWSVEVRGEELIYQTSLSPVQNEEGQVISLVGIGRDVTRQKQHEKQLLLLATAIEQVANGVVISDEKTVFQYVNSAFVQITGYSQQESIGNDSRLLQSGMHPPSYYDEMKKTLKDGKAWRGEFINRRKNGELYYELNTITPLIDADGNITNFISIKEDITEMRRTQEAEEAQRRMSETLTEIASVLNRSLHIDDTLDLILANVSKVLPLEAIDITLLENGTVRSVRQLGFLERDLMDWLRSNTYTLDEFPLMKRIYDSQCALWVGDAQAEQDWILVGETEWVRSFVGAPIRKDGEVLGFITVYHTQPHIYTDMHATNLQGFADLASIALVNANLFEDSQRQIRKLASLRHIDKAIGSSLDIDLTLRIVIDQVVQLLKVDAAAIYLLNPYMQELECRASHGLLAHDLLKRNIHLSEFPIGDVVMDRKTVHLTKDDLKQQAHPRWSGFDEFHSLHITPLIVKGQVKGVLEVMTRQEHKTSPDWASFLETLAGQTAIAIDNAELYGQLQKANSDLALSFHSTLEYLARALELRNGEGEGHTRRAADLTLQIARSMGVHGNDMQNVYRGALMHDIGTLLLPENLMQKRGELTDEERQLIYQHPEHASTFFNTIAYLRPAMEIPYCHHERWDGSGYPRGLKGEEIPLSARIFAVVDVWDALRSDRPYRPAWNDADALEYIRDGAGALFDPQVVNIFLQKVVASPDRLSEQKESF